MKIASSTMRMWEKIRNTKLDMVQWLGQAGASCLLLGGSIADQIDIVWEDFPALGRAKGKIGDFNTFLIFNFLH